MFEKSILAVRPFKLALFASFALAAAGASAPVLAAVANTATATVTANVIQPLTISKYTDLEFGYFAANPDGAGTITLKTNDAQTVTGGVVGKNYGQAASFRITGESGEAFAVSTAGTSTELTHHVDPTKTMAMTLIGEFVVANGSSSSFTAPTGTSVADFSAGPNLGGWGATMLYIGGQLAVGQAQLAGQYDGTVQIEVNYN